MTAFGVNDARRVSLRHLGEARAPLLCIDEFSSHPDELVALARRADFIDVGSQFPGVRAPAPAGYVSTLFPALAPLLEQHFGAPPEDELDLCAFSLVTTPPARLSGNQRLPHIDGPEERRFAVLHYLCGAEQGGTAFYRHRATGLEVVTACHVRHFHDTVIAEMRRAEPAAGYVTTSNQDFERIGGVDAAYNRVIVYRGNALHSGDIGAATVFSEDPRVGRLTINGFGFLR
jgi:hypothetical protein